MCKITGLGTTRAVVFVLAACLLSTLACGVPTFLTNYTTSLGVETPGQQQGTPGLRGTVTAVVVNNTPFFASFTIGAYDQLYDTQTMTGYDPANPSTSANYYQFFADPAYPQYHPLEGNTPPQTFTFECRRAVSLGDHDLIQAIRKRDTDAKLSMLDPEDEGITFSDKLPTDASAQKFTINGFANQVQLLGVNYQCYSLVVFTFELDANQPYKVRIDASVVLP